MIMISLAFLATCVPQDPGERIAAACAESNGLASSRVIGQSAGGRPIHLVRLTGSGASDAPVEADRTATLIAAGAHGHHQLGTELALWQVEKLIADYAANDEATRELLDRQIVFIVPLINPDGAAMNRIGNQTSLDVDRDGQSDEDTVDDLDGNDLITHMRWPDPDGEWLIDADDPRIVTKADTDKGERGTHHVEFESLDADGDEQRAEDNAEGVHVHRNFSQRFDEFDRNTGPFPMSEPETRALADFVFAHREIVRAFVWGIDDNLLETPKVEEPKSRIQLNGILKGDKELFEKAGELYRELTEREGKTSARQDGSVWSWLHFQVGIPTWATDVWRLPEGGGKGDDKQTPEQARLAWCEETGFGFVDWTEFDHPQLGKVEVGGFVNDLDPRHLPQDQREPLFGKHHEFFLQTASWAPDCRIDSFEAEAIAGGAFRLKAVVQNDGGLPALTAMGDKSRRFTAPRLLLELGDAKLLAGFARSRVRNLKADGTRQEFEWIVAGKAGQKIQAVLTCDPVGESRLEVTL